MKLLVGIIKIKNNIFNSRTDFFRTYIFYACYGFLLCFFTICFALLLSGCYSYPDMPDCVSKNNYTSLKGSQSRGIPPTTESLTLESAISIALANNPDYLSRQQAITAAWARVYSAFSAYIPTATAVYNWQENYYTPASQGGDGRKDIYSRKGGAIEIQWMIFDGLVAAMNGLAARSQAKQAEDLNRDSRRLLIYGVTTAFNNVLLAKSQIRIAREDEDFNNELLRETEIKYKAGAVSLSEPLNFKVKANLAESNRIAAEYRFYINKCILAELLGLTDGVIPENVKFPDIIYRVETFPIDVSVYLDMALQNRPDLQAYREALEASKYNLWSVYGQFLPTVTLNATPLGYQRIDDAPSGRWNFRQRTEDRNIDYGFNASWVLFSGGQRLANMREAQALLAQSQLSLTARWITVVSEVFQAYENCKQSCAQTTLFNENLALIRKTRDLVEEEYKAGKTSVTRLNEAQRDLVKAETDLVTYQINLENAKAQLKSVVGGE